MTTPRHDLKAEADALRRKLYLIDRALMFFDKMEKLGAGIHVASADRSKIEFTVLLDGSEPEPAPSPARHIDDAGRPYKREAEATTTLSKPAKEVAEPCQHDTSIPVHHTGERECVGCGEVVETAAPRRVVEAGAPWKPSHLDQRPPTDADIRQAELDQEILELLGAGHKCGAVAEMLGVAKAEVVERYRQLVPDASFAGQVKALERVREIVRAGREVPA